MDYEKFLEIKKNIPKKIPEELNNNRELVIEILHKIPMALESVSDTLRDDYDVVDTAVKQNGLALQFASERLKNDFSIVMNAVLENGWSLQFASQVLKYNPEIVKYAMWTDNRVLKLASEYVQKLYDPAELLAAGKETNPINIPKSGRLSYTIIKELYTEVQAISSELHKSQSEEILDRLDILISEIRILSRSSSIYLNTVEVTSDLELIIEYYDKQEWNNVTRWLSNIDSSLREMWSNYIEKIIAKKNQ